MISSESCNVVFEALKEQEPTQYSNPVTEVPEEGKPFNTCRTDIETTQEVFECLTDHYYTQFLQQ